MNKQITLLSTLAASLLVSFAAQAADTAELKVNGTVRPAACIPAFSGGGVVDYGTIPAKSLQAGQITTLPVKSIDFVITCDAATSTAIRLIDNRAGTVPPGLINSSTFGLGTVNGTKIGAYWVNFPSFSIDDRAATLVYHNPGDPMNRWWLNDSEAVSTKRLYSWSNAPTRNAPVLFKTVKLTVNVQVQIDKPENLPLTQEIPLDGSMTIEMRYL